MEYIQSELEFFKYPCSKIPVKFFEDENGHQPTHGIRGSWHSASSSLVNRCLEAVQTSRDSK